MCPSSPSPIRSLALAFVHPDPTHSPAVTMQRISMLFAFLAAIGLCLLSTAQAYIVLSSDLDNPEQKIDPAVQLAAENLRDVQARVPELNHAKPDLNRYVVVTPGSKLASSFQPVTVAKSMPSLARRRLNLEVRSLWSLQRFIIVSRSIKMACYLH